MVIKHFAKIFQDHFLFLHNDLMNTFHDIKQSLTEKLIKKNHVILELKNSILRQKSCKEYMRAHLGTKFCWSSFHHLSSESASI